MCGIFGYVGNIDKSIASRCSEAIRHRGPDGDGLVVFDGATLAHRRLSIIDLSDNASQPMSYANERYWITYNGEIYNFHELRNELIGYGFYFKSKSDTEVILAAYEMWGEGCQKRFNGMWAFAIWDTLAKTLFLSRDRFGKKPLFYRFCLNNEFAFCSEMKGLFPLMPQVRANHKIVSDISGYMIYESTESCAIEGIIRFPAGSCGLFYQGKLSIKRWWNTLDNLITPPSKYEDQVEQFRELFFDACKLRMRSDVPIGTALSGGLDSSATFSCMATLGRENITNFSSSWQHAFVASFPGSPLDEVEYAKEVARGYGVTPVIVEVDPLAEINALNKYMYLQEDPYITSPIPFMQLYRAVKNAGISVTLDGHGADELFGGYSFDIIHALYDCSFNDLKSKEVIETFYEMHGSSSQLIPSISRSRLMFKWQTKKIARNLAFWHKKQESFRLDSLNAKLFESTHCSVLPTLLRNYDRYSMSNGVEIRMPFMDHRIVAFAFSIPWTSKVRGGYSKAIIRDALREIIPEKIAHRKEKIGFNSPVVEWMKGPLKPFLLDTISDRDFKESTLINPIEVRKVILDAISNKNTNFQNATLAWMKLTPYLWEKAMLKKVNYL